MTRAPVVGVSKSNLKPPFGDFGHMDQSLRGNYLIAGRHLQDPNFYRAVVLIVEHNESGSMGFVLNRPTDVEIRKALSEHFSVPEAADPVYFGGPVEPSALFLIHDDAGQSEEELPVVPGLFLGANADTFEAIVTTAAEAGTHYRVFSGCAGWGPEQLESELARGDWYLAPADPEAIFHGDPYEQWDTLIERVAPRHPLFKKSAVDFRWN